jgi:hypothetical protein
MAQFFPGVLYAALAAVPGFILGALLAAPTLWELPPANLLTALAKGSVHFTLLYGIVTIVYGGVAWFGLRFVGFLNLFALVIAGLAPVATCVAWSLLSRGYDPGWVGAVVAFGVPALFVSVALWWFTVALPARG